MNNLKTLSAAVALALSGGVFSTSAAAGVIVGGELPENAYITVGDYDWAWANPWAYDYPSSQFDISVQAAFGWRIPTLEELVFAPTALEFMFDGANVPFGGPDPVSTAYFSFTTPTLTGDAACATPYFSTRNWCDWGNGRGVDDEDWAGTPGYGTYWDTVVIRNANGANPVPAPMTLALLGLGLAALGWSRRKA